MTTSTFYADSSDASVRCHVDTWDAGTWADVWAGLPPAQKAISAAEYPTTAGATATYLSIGLRDFNDFLNCFQAAIRFATQDIPDGDTITSATVSLYGTLKTMETEQDLEVRAFDWGTTLETTEYRTPSQLGALTLLATFDTTGYSTSAYNDFTSESAVTSWVNKTGDSRAFVCLEGNRTSSPPTAAYSDWVKCSSADETGTTQDPKLVVVHSSGAAYVPGDPFGMWGFFG